VVAVLVTASRATDRTSGLQHLFGYAAPPSVAAHPRRVHVDTIREGKDSKDRPPVGLSIWIGNVTPAHGGFVDRKDAKDTSEPHTTSALREHKALGLRCYSKSPNPWNSRRLGLELCMQHLLIALGLGFPGIAWAAASVLRARYRHKCQVAYRNVVMTLSVTAPEQVPAALRAIWGQQEAVASDSPPPVEQSGKAPEIDERASSD
jgi:hypothetical protein